MVYGEYHCYGSLHLSRLFPFPVIHLALAFAPDKGEHAGLAVFPAISAMMVNLSAFALSRAARMGEGPQSGGEGSSMKL